jgi:hypothetical protein
VLARQAIMDIILRDKNNGKYRVNYDEYNSKNK